MCLKSFCKVGVGPRAGLWDRYKGWQLSSSEVNLQFVDLVHISVSHPSNFLFYSDSAHYHCTTRLSRTPLQISLSPRATRAVQICH